MPPAALSIVAYQLKMAWPNHPKIMPDTHRGRVEDDAVYVLRHDDGDLRVKRIQRKMDGTLIVMNDNKEYSDDVFSPAEAARLNVVGRVVWRGCRM